MSDASKLAVTIVDGYVDEPAHFGVPPYISTYPRFTAGAIVEAGVPASRLTYLTIDKIRENPDTWKNIERADLLIYVGGMTVPGKYVGGTPAEPMEVRKIGWVANGVTVLGGPVKFGVGTQNQGAIETSRDDLDFDFVAKGDIEAAAFDLVRNQLSGFGDRMRTSEEIERWARAGAFIVEQHPNHPAYLICEIETARGCPYRCSFCTEPLYGSPTFRSPTSIIREVSSLYDSGIRHFRLGRQADILAYGGDGEEPNPDALRSLYTGIRQVAPELETLHLDNINPITIISWPEQAKEGLEIIAQYNTPGDTAAFGLESADPIVQEQNNLNVTADECVVAIRIVNEIGAWRQGDDRSTQPKRNLPKLLPGINLVHGLKGERPKTFEHNRRFLQRVLDEGLLVRRVNIRQVMAFSGTEMASIGATIAHDHNSLFKKYKKEVREAFDYPMLQRVAPTGTVLSNVHLEYHQKGRTFGRQLGTYPLLVGTPGKYPLNTVIDIIVVDHGYRSVTGLKYPVSVNDISMAELTSLPGVGKRRARTLVANRPFSSAREIEAAIEVDLQEYLGDELTHDDDQKVSDGGT